jgi:hypothetical protein
MVFEACSAFTHVTACRLAKSPSDPLHRRLRRLCCLHRRSDCYRVERSSSRAGLLPAVGDAVEYALTRSGVSNLWQKKLVGGPPKQITNFESGSIFDFDWSRDGRQLALTRGSESSDVILISNFR